MIILFVFLSIVLAIDDFIINHVDKGLYREIHPLFDEDHLELALMKAKDKSYKVKEQEYKILSLHDSKYYETMTWNILININDNLCHLNEEVSIDDIKYELVNDNCTLYSSIVMYSNILLKIGCPLTYGNVFLKPNKKIYNGCTKTVKIRPKNLLKDLSNLVQKPNITNLLNLLIPCYGNDNIIIDQNFKYKKPQPLPYTNTYSQVTYSDGNIRNVLKNYFHKKNLTYDKNNFKEIKEGKTHIKTVESNAPWGLDRIDQRTGLNYQYVYTTTATDITAIVIDTGILETHVEFGGRAQFSYNAVGDGIDTDCAGHGTHVSGIIGSATYGVAKGIQLRGVKVLDCSGSGSSSTITAGVLWIIANQDTLRGGAANIKKLVSNLSLGGPADSVIDNAVNQLVQNNIAVSVAAGNDAENGPGQGDACLYSPARLSTVLSVGASDINDMKPPWSNYGSCVDLTAPGVGILSTWIGSNTALNTISGTSMASPFVCGVMALTWQQDKTLVNSEVQSEVLDWVTPNVISGASSDGGGANLLYSLVNPNIIEPPIAPIPITNDSLKLMAQSIFSFILLVVFLLV